MKRVLNRTKNISVSQRLYIVVGTMGLLIAIQLIFFKVALQQVSAVRAFIEGEALWSKAQKNAVLELKRYHRTHDEARFARFA